VDAADVAARCCCNYISCGRQRSSCATPPTLPSALSVNCLFGQQLAIVVEQLILTCCQQFFKLPKSARNKQLTFVRRQIKKDFVYL